MRCLHEVEVSVCVYSLHNGGAPQYKGWGGEESLNKVIIFVFFAHKKYSRSFIKLQLNPWCHMEYFTDVLATLLDLDRGSNLAVYGRVRELSDVFKSILICVPKDERRSYEFGTTWGCEINDRIFIFGWTSPLILLCLCTCMHVSW